jgi:hypothetical protein
MPSFLSRPPLSSSSSSMPAPLSSRPGSAATPFEGRDSCVLPLPCDRFTRVEAEALLAARAALRSGALPAQPPPPPPPPPQPRASSASSGMMRNWLSRALPSVAAPSLPALPAFAGPAV